MVLHFFLICRLCRWIKSGKPHQIIICRFILNHHPHDYCRFPNSFTCEGYRWLWLGLSAIFGLVLGDAMLFQAYVLIGPRFSMLVMASVPAISASFCMDFLKRNSQSLPNIWNPFDNQQASRWLYWITTLNSGHPFREEIKNQILGLFLSFGGAFGQAIGMIFAKKGLVGDFSALTGVLIRMIVAAGASIWLIAAFSKEIRSNFQFLNKIQNPFVSIFGGAFVGPFSGSMAFTSLLFKPQK